MYKYMYIRMYMCSDAESTPAVPASLSAIYTCTMYMYVVADIYVIIFTSCAFLHGGNEAQVVREAQLTHSDTDTAVSVQLMTHCVDTSGPSSMAIPLIRPVCTD